MNRCYDYLLQFRFIPRILLTLILLFSCLIAGCSKNAGDDEDGIRLYYINSDETQIVSEAYKPMAVDTRGLIAELILALDQAPSNQTYKKAKPDTISVLSYTLEEDKLVLDFDSGYSTLTGISEILSRAAIVKTFFQVVGLEEIEFYVNGLPFMLSAELPLGSMQADDFIYNTGAATNYSQTTSLTVYFTNKTGDALRAYERKIDYDASISIEQLIVKFLIQGPTDEESGVYKTLPEGTLLNKVTVKDSVCYVDLNSAFLEKRPEVTEEVTIYSIVNSLIEESNIAKVQFLIDGEQKKAYQNMDLTILYERNLEIIESE